jgi:predicted transcriptional regulator
LLEEIKKNEMKEIYVTFIKKSDGQKRVMRCMYGVQKENSKGMNYDAEKKGLVSVFDLDKQEYRVFPIANMIRLGTESEEFEIEGLRRRG